MRTLAPLPLDVRLMRLAASLLLLVFALMALYALAGWAVRQPVFAIRGVTVLGDTEHSNAPTLRANVAPRLNGTFFTLDLEAARRVFEQQPWVRRAVVRREFPNRLRVILQEHRVAAYWGEEGDSTLVNRQGEVFEVNLDEVEPDGLPRLSGPQGQSALVLAAYRALAPLFDALDLPIAELGLSGRGSWWARLDNGASLMLGGGTQDELVTRSWRFTRTLTQVASHYARAPAALESADLRHMDGYALRLRGVGTLESRSRQETQ